MDLGTIAMYDHHAHTPRRWEAGLDIAGLRACLALGSTTAAQASSTVIYRHALRELAAFHGCAPNEAAILAARAGRTAPELLRQAAEQAGLAAVLLDDGFVADDGMTFAEARAALPCASARICRVETLAERLMHEHGERFDAFDAAFREAIADLHRQGVVALKSVAAYRCGLRLATDVRRHFAASAYDDEYLHATRSGSKRLSSLVLISYLVGLALDEAARQELPFQFHTGFGDEAIDLRTGSPLHMRDLITHEPWRGVRFVLLHSYPSVREVAFMTRVFPNVWMDLSLATLLTAHGAQASWLAALELAPAERLLYGSDAFSLPELLWLGARAGRASLGSALGSLVAGGWLDTDEATTFAQQILYQNACDLYGNP